MDYGIRTLRIKSSSKLYTKTVPRQHDKLRKTRHSPFQSEFMSSNMAKFFHSFTHECCIFFCHRIYVLCLVSSVCMLSFVLNALSLSFALSLSPSHLFFSLSLSPSLPPSLPPSLSLSLSFSYSLSLFLLDAEWKGTERGHVRGTTALL